MELEQMRVDITNQMDLFSSPHPPPPSFFPTPLPTLTRLI